jgi:chromosome segregation ATPase
VDMDTDLDVEVPEVENAMPELESALQEAESAIEDAESELNEKFADLTSQVEEAQHELEKLGKIDEHVNLMDGRTLKRLRILGLSEQSRNELLKQLPVHEGDKLSKDLIEKLEKALHAFDGHLSCFAIPSEDNNATILIERK